ncbi:MAG: helicase-related protein [Spirochaetales bacterium]|nr:helicase-related protein [Spirochaetales bacterium]
MKDFYNEKVKELFGLDYIFPWQRLVMAHTLEALGYWGEERQRELVPKSLVVLPTGAGKSLCFLMPALLVDGITLILYPLLALMNDQARRLREDGHRPVLFRGGQSREEREEGWRILKEGKSRFILTNPETAGTEEFRERLSHLRVVHLVIDEVHTIPQWGTSFREGLLSVGGLVEKGDIPVVTAFTATASPESQEKIGSLVFRHAPFHRILADPDRPNIAYHVLYTPFVTTALEELCLREEKPILIFCRTRAQTMETARYLERRVKGKGEVRAVRFYHAGLTAEEKEETEAWFRQERGALLCATSAYGMGVDSCGLKTVIHRDIPYSVESYLQEAGRAGRRGEESRSFVLVPPGGEGEGPIKGYLSHRSHCRRTLLMEALGWESSYCGGCDYCTPRSFLPLVDRWTYRFFRLLRLYSRCFTQSEWCDFLKGYGRGFERVLPGFGLLRRMERDQIGEAFYSYERAGQITRSGRWQGKGRVIAKRRKN